MTLRTLHALGLTALLTLLPLFGAGADDLAVAPFEARYTVYGQGIPLGEGSITLENLGQGRYRMRATVHPTGLAAMLISDRIDESVEGRCQDGRVLPQLYRQQRSGGKRSHDIRTVFDWSQGRVQTSVNQQQASLRLPVGAVDPLSLHLKVMTDLKRSVLAAQYTFLDESELKTYQVQRQGEELLKTPLGTLRTVRVKQQKPDSTRITTLWFAPELDYLPVQIAQEKKGKEVLRMLIQDVKIRD
ncbi:MAG TPA: DUF3108 domain-containing protein [Candidatus Competibacteraceae bacterium]|nr:DUF3108 domain-containing protein [Candidatus Competibacteraceae bacterium]